jgi:hypothetical protein
MEMHWIPSCLLVHVLSLFQSAAPNGNWSRLLFVGVDRIY